jgi:hypothetical protein
VDEQTPQPGEDEVGGTRQRGSEGEAQGSTASNQGKAEPMPSTPGHKDPNAPLEPPSLEDMNVGSADPQLPRHPLATRSGLELHEPVTPAPADVGGPGSAPAEQRPAASTGSSTGRASGPEHPAETSEGTAHKAPGIQGSTGSDEVLETDVVSSAARMGPSAPARSRATARRATRRAWTCPRRRRRSAPARSTTWCRAPARRRTTADRPGARVHSDAGVHSPTC